MENRSRVLRSPATARYIHCTPSVRHPTPGSGIQAAMKRFPSNCMFRSTVYIATWGNRASASGNAILSCKESKYPNWAWAQSVIPLLSPHSQHHGSHACCFQRSNPRTLSRTSLDRVYTPHLRSEDSCVCVGRLRWRWYIWLGQFVHLRSRETPSPGFHFRKTLARQRFLGEEGMLYRFETSCLSVFKPGKRERENER